MFFFLAEQPAASFGHSFWELGQKHQDYQAPGNCQDTLDDVEPLPRCLAKRAVEVLLNAVGNQTRKGSCDGRGPKVKG